MKSADAAIVDPESGATVTCSHCGAPNTPSREYCVECLSELGSGANAAGTLPKIAQAKPPEPMPPAAPSPEELGLPACATHADQVAVGPCSTCGTFYCELCVPKPLPRSPAECASCTEIRAKQEHSKRSAAAYTELSWVVGLTGVICGALVFVGGVARNAEHLGSWAAGAFVCFFPLALLALLIAMFRRRWLAWVGAVPASLVLFACSGFLVLLSRSQLLWAAAAWIPLALVRMLAKSLLHLGNGDQPQRGRSGN